MSGPSARQFRPLLMAAVLLLAGCGSDSYFGTPEAPPLPGTRIAILEQSGDAKPDPSAGEIRPALPPAIEGAWEQSYGGPGHDAGHRALAPVPSLAWTVDIGEGDNGEERRIVYPPVASSTTVYALDAGGKISAVAADTGREVWRVDPTPEDEDEGFGGGLAYADGVLYFAAGFAELVALDGATGAERWRAALPTPSRAAPTVDGGRVFVITIDNRLLAIDTETGKTRWSFQAPPATAALLGGASPAAGQGAVVAATTSGEIVAFRAANGRITWDDALTAVRRLGVAQAIPAVRASPVIADGEVIAIGAAGLAAGIDFATGSRIWDRAIGGNETPAVAGAFLYMITDQPNLAALRRSDGAIAWTIDLNAAAGDIDPDKLRPEIYAGPIAAGGHLIVTRGKGEAMFFKAEDGALAHRITLPGNTSLPVIVANRTMYVLTDSGVLAAYK